MRIVARILKWFVFLVLILCLGAAGWLYMSPPELLRVATAYSVKMVCSNHFLAKRDPAEVLAVDVQAPGHPILKYVSVKQVDDATFSASIFGIFATEYAVNRAGLGCASVPDHDLAAVKAISLLAEPVVAPASDFEWPLGDQVSLANHQQVNAIISDPALAGPGVRGVVVVKDGRIIGEYYPQGFSAETPLLGWSMTKTITGALVGMRVAEGKLSYGQDKLFPDWTDGR
ncbi:MAG: hypothetical protein RLZZ444_975, partial [Pseudomonadota bacterium]